MRSLIGRLFRHTTLEGLSLATLLIQMYSLMIALAFGLGVVILTGGDGRFSGTALSGARDLANWVPILEPQEVWGALFLLLSFALVWGIGKRAAIHILRFALVVYLFLAIAFLNSSGTDPTVALTAVVAYVTFGIAHALISVELDLHGWR